MKFFDILKKLIKVLQLLGLDNQKIYEICRAAIHDWIIKVVELKDDDLEKWIEDLICEITDNILRAVFFIEEKPLP